MAKYRIELDCDKIADLYLSGKTAEEIGKMFGVSKNPILHQLRKSDIQIRSGREIKDLTGKRFGRLVVLHLDEKRKNGQIAWLCQCNCGNTTSVQVGHLSSGATRSCGCLQREIASQIGVIDITGQRFGRWLVLNRASEQGGDSICWTCKCDCGTIRSVDGASLRSGKSRSCGCISAEIRAEQCGTKSPNWNPNLTEEERQKKRNYPEYREWRDTVFKRDNYVCQKCGERGGNLCSHHIESYRDNPELRTTLENGVTLCKKHHDDFHHQFGYGNNTRKQFEQFLSEGKELSKWPLDLIR